MKINEFLGKYVDAAPCFVVIQGKRYYFKFVEDEGHELVGDSLANICGINCAKDSIVLVKGDYYYLSYDLNNDGEYTDAAKLGFTSLSMYNIWNTLEEKYPKYPKKLMKELVKIYVFDALLLYGDRHLNNFGILDDNGTLSFYILDNEMIFSVTDDIRLKPIFSNGDKLKKYIDFNLDSETVPYNLGENLKSFEYFIATLGEEFYKVVLDIYYKLTPDVVEKSLLKVHDDYDDILEMDTIEEDMYLYNVNYDCVTKILVERGLINGQRIY